MEPAEVLFYWSVIVICCFKNKSKRQLFRVISDFITEHGEQVPNITLCFLFPCTFDATN